MVARVTRRSALESATKHVEESKDATSNTHFTTSSSSRMSGGSKFSKLRARKSSGKDGVINASTAHPSPAPTKTSRKRSRVTVVKDEEEEDDGHVPSTAPISNDRATKEEEDVDTSLVKSKKPRNATSAVSPKKESDAVEKSLDTASTPSKAKAKTYGMTPGQTPYPDFPHPTAEECKEMVRLLSAVHGKVEAPKSIPIPSLTVSGCGEVPSVLDALIRTRLSAATSNTNSSRAFAGLVAKFGVLEKGVGKGSVDWNKVRLAETKDIFEAIKSGGLADVKSKDIKKILQMVWEENQLRRDSLQSGDGTFGTTETSAESQTEISKSKENVLSLDHLHQLSTDDAFDALTKYPGVGPKTASCVLLFCLQRPSFAVDTHVFRLTKWLGWVPAPGDPAGLAPGAKGNFSGPTRNSTYAHLNVKIPDDLKYPLHYLFIKHGRTCPRCRAITGENSDGWSEGCAIDHLVKRHGGRKDSRPSPTKPKTPDKRKVRGKRKKSYADDSDEESWPSESNSDYESSD